MDRRFIFRPRWVRVRAAGATRVGSASGPIGHGPSPARRRRRGFKDPAIKRRGRRKRRRQSKRFACTCSGKKTLGRELAQRPYRTPTQVGEGKYLQVDE